MRARLCGLLSKRPVIKSQDYSLFARQRIQVESRLLFIPRRRRRRQLTMAMHRRHVGGETSV